MLGPVRVCVYACACTRHLLGTETFQSQSSISIFIFTTVIFSFFCSLCLVFFSSCPLLHLFSATLLPPVLSWSPCFYFISLFHRFLFLNLLAFCTFFSFPTPLSFSTLNLFMCSFICWHSTLHFLIHNISFSWKRHKTSDLKKKTKKKVSYVHLVNPLYPKRP